MIKQPMKESGSMNEKSAQDARQGRILPQKKGLKILGVSLALAVVAIILAWIFVV